MKRAYTTRQNGILFIAAPKIDASRLPGIFVCLFLTASLLFTAPTGVAASAKNPVKNALAFTVSADAATTNATRIDAPELVRRVKELISNAASVASRPSGVKSAARFTAEFSGGEKSDYILYSDGIDGYFFYDGRYHSVDLKSVHEIISDINGFYKYRWIPRLTVEENGISREIPSSQNDFSYRRLDGSFCRLLSKEKTGNPIVVRTSSPTFPVPDIPLMPDSAQLKVSRNGKVVFGGAPSASATLALVAGEVYQVELSLSYSSEYYKGDVSYSYRVEASGDGTFGISADASGSDPGEIVVLRAWGLPAGQKIGFQSDIPFTPNFFEDENGVYTALLPVSYFVPVGNHYIQLSAGGISQRFEVTVKNKEFQIQRITVDAQTADNTINSGAANAEYERVIGPLRPVADSERRWAGRFEMPVSGGRRTTEFGSIRYTNGQYDSRHGALDIALPTGTRVSASNSGRVLYAGYLQLTGNTVLIEHGFGLKTWYYHMNALSVATGDLVEKGQKIGEVGSTGFSTGPHLHFGMSVNNVFVNPVTLIETDLLNY